MKITNFKPKSLANLSDKISFRLTELGPFDKNFPNQNISSLEETLDYFEVTNPQEILSLIEKNSQLYTSLGGPLLQAYMAIPQTQVITLYEKQKELLTSKEEDQIYPMKLSYDTITGKMITYNYKTTIKFPISTNLDSWEISKTRGEEYLYFPTGWQKVEIVSIINNIVTAQYPSTIKQEKQKKITFYSLLKVLPSRKKDVTYYFSKDSIALRKNSLVNLYKDVQVNSARVPVSVTLNKIELNKPIELKTKTILAIPFDPMKKIRNFTVISNNQKELTIQGLTIDDVDFINRSIILEGRPIASEYSINKTELTLETLYQQIIKELPSLNLYKGISKPTSTKFLGNLNLESLQVIMLLNDKEIVLVDKGKAKSNIEAKYTLYSDVDKKKQIKKGDVDVEITMKSKPAKLPIMQDVKLGDKKIKTSIDLKANDPKEQIEFYFDYKTGVNKYGLIRVGDEVRVIDKNNNIKYTTRIESIDINSNEIYLKSNIPFDLGKGLYLLIDQYPLDYNKKYRIYITAIDREETGG